MLRRAFFYGIKNDGCEDGNGKKYEDDIIRGMIMGLIVSTNFISKSNYTIFCPYSILQKLIYQDIS